MKLFGNKKEKSTPCCCGGNCAPSAPSQGSGTAKVKILGAGCAKCNALEKAARSALSELHMDTAIDHVTDFAQIAAYGVMATPALVVDDQVVSYGKVLSTEEIKALILKEQG